MMNSTFGVYALKLINPTVNFQVGDLARLPIPTTSSDTLHDLVDQAITLAKANSEEDETTYGFIAPPWTASLEKTLCSLCLRGKTLGEIERQIDEEVFRLYGISEED
ncbi:MAG: hypothetical protein HY731_07680 [Candidatus Tectomicrobia bacterium]|nr:hypothetical protein [Candidatus Tectomicrobia bacterium]